MVEIARVEHTGHVMKDPISYHKVFRSGPKAIFLTSLVGQRPGMFQLDCISGLIGEIAKLEGRWN